MNTLLLSVCILYLNAIMIALNASSWYHSNETLPDGIYEQQLGYNQNPNHLDLIDIYSFGGNLGVDCKRFIWKSSFNKTSKLLSPWITLKEKTIKQCITSEMQNSITIDDIVYFVGVYDYDFTYYPTGATYRFNMTSEKWLNTSFIPKQPIPQIKGCVATNNSHIFSIGGFNFTKPPQSTITNTLQILDINKNKWSIQYLPFPMVYQYCNMVNNNILYAIGGQQTFDGLERYHGIYKYNVLQSNSEWQFIGNLTKNSAREKGWLAYDYQNKLLYPIGGDPLSSNIDIFNIETDEIIGTNTVINSNDQVSSAPVLIINDTIMVFGGANKNQQSNVVQMSSLPLT